MFLSNIYLGELLMIKRRSFIILSILLTGGCNIVGPTAISNGRSVYNEVISRTNDEQVLDMMVRLRYEESFGMLNVASVTANIRVRANIGAEFGVGDESNFQGNLVPLSAGVAYEENPTISYVPVQGEQFITRLLSPIPVKTIVLLALSTDNPEGLLKFLAKQLNGLKNALYADIPGDEEFDHALDLIASLHKAGVLDFGIIEGEKPQYRMVIYSYQDEHAETVRELMRLLGLPDPPADGSDIVLPIRLAIGHRPSDSIAIKTRSIYAIIKFMGWNIEVPEAHLEAGIVSIRQINPNRQSLTIRSSTERPGNATVATQFRNHWFYIDATDIKTKRAFSFVQLLIGMRLQKEDLLQQAPVLTIPVGG